MFYTYILYSVNYKIFYFGHTVNLKKRFWEHNKVLVKSTKPCRPWKLVFYAAFETLNQAKNFERYLKTGSGKAFAYKRLVDATIRKKFNI